MAVLVKVIAIQGNVLHGVNSQNVQLLKAPTKITKDSKLIIDEASSIIIQLPNGKIIKISGRDLLEQKGEVDLNQIIGLQEDKPTDDLTKIKDFANNFSQLDHNDQLDQDIIRLDDGRIFQKVGKDYVEVASDSFDDASSNGHKFVQVERIGDQFSTDGLSPLTLNRISENTPILPVNNPINTTPFLSVRENPINPDENQNSKNLPPEAINDIYATHLNTPISLNPLINDFDLDSKTIKITTINGQPYVLNTEIKVPNGTVIIDGKGGIQFVPDNGFTGVVEFPYTIEDEHGGKATAKEIITIKPMITNSISRVSEEGLDGGLKDDLGDDQTNSVIFEGTFQVDKMTADLTYSFVTVPSQVLTSNGQKIEWVLNEDKTTLIGKVGDQEIIKVELNQKTGDYKVTLIEHVDHPNSQIEDIVDFNLSVNVVDANGFSSDGILTVIIEDDSPIASDDSNHIVEDDQSVIGNVLTNDSAGADGSATVISVNETAVENKPVSIEGTYGRLELNVDGSYTYILDNSKEAVQALKEGEEVFEEFHYSMRDADGDVSQAKLVIGVTGKNDAPVIDQIKTSAKAVVSEEGLANANPDGIGNEDTTNEKIFNGKIVATDVDHDAILKYTFTGVPQESLTSNGQAVEWTLSEDKTTVIGKLADGSNVVSIQLEQNTGEYTVTLFAPVDHPNTKEEDTLDFTVPYQVSDEKGATAQSKITVTIEDDSPVLVKNGTTLVLDEKYLDFGSETNLEKTTATGKLEVSWGADGGSNKNVEFTIQTKEALEKWVNNELNSNSVSISISNDHHTLVAKDGDKELFEVTLNINANGEIEYTFTLKNSLDHQELDVLTLPFESIHITDADGDSVEGSFKVTIVDDHPNTKDVKTIEVNEDLYIPTGGQATNTFNTNADATGSNTFIGKDSSVSGSVKTPHGSAIVNENGTITYTPDPNYSGKDTFTYTTVNDDGTSAEYTVEVVVKPISNDPPALTHSQEILCTPEDTSIKLGLNVPKVTDDTDQNTTGLGDQPERLGSITLTLSGLGTTTVATGNNGQNTGVFLVDNNGIPLKQNTDGSYTIVLVDNEGNILSSHVADLELENPNINYLTKEQYEEIQAQPGDNRHENFNVKVTVTSYEVDENGKIDLNVMGTGTTLEDQSDDKLGIGATSSETIQVTVQAVTDNAALLFDKDVTLGSAEFIKSKENKQQSIDAKHNQYEVVYGESDATVTLSEDYAVNLKDITNIQFDDLDGSETRTITIENPKDSGGNIRVFDGTEWKTVEPGSSITIVSKDGFAGQTGNEDSFVDIKIAGAENQSQNINGIKVTINTQDSDSDSAKCGGPISEKDLSDNSVIINLVINPVAGDVTISDVSTKEDTAVAFLAKLKVQDKSQNGMSATSTDGEVINEVSFTIPENWKVIKPESTSGWSVNEDEVTGKYTIIFDSTLTEEAREAILAKFEILPPAHSSKDLKDLEVTVKTTDTNGQISDTTDTLFKLNIEVTPVAERLEKIDGTKGNNSQDWKATDTDGAAANANEDGSDIADLTMNGDHKYSYKADLTQELNFVYDRSIANYDPSIVYPPNTISFNDFKKDNSFAFEGEPFYINQDQFDLKAGWFNEDGMGVRPDSNGHKEETYAKLTAYSGDQSIPVDGATFEYSMDGGITWLPAELVNGNIAVPMEYLDYVRVNIPGIYDDGLFAIKVEALTVDTDEDDGSKVYAVSGVAWLTNILVLPTASEVTLQVNQRVVMKEDSSKELFIRTQSSDAKEKFEIKIQGLPEGSKITIDGHIFDTLDQASWKVGDKYELVESKDGTFTLTLHDMSLGVIKPVYTPPLNSNTNGDNTELKVTAQTIDESHGFISIGEETTLPIEISVIGVPDQPILEVNTNLTWVENDLDQQEGGKNLATQENQANLIDLDKFIKQLESGELASTPDDNSETLSLRITGLPEGFELVNQAGKAIVTLLGGEGENRVWLISKDDLDKISIRTPVNYSGEQSFIVQPVVTENDGSSTLFAKQEVTFIVTPSPEVTLAASSSVWEDTIDGKLGQLNLSEVYQNGDQTNEKIVAIRINAQQLSDKNIILYTDESGTSVLQPKADGYIYLNAGDKVYVRGPANFSGEKVIDIEYIAKDSYTNKDGKVITKYSGESENDWSKAGKVEHKLNFKAVTDEVLLEVHAIEKENGKTEFTAVKNDQEITVSLDISKKVDESSKQALDSTEDNERDYDFNDKDGGEQINYYVISGVPEGIIVKGAYYLGEGKWMLEAKGNFTGMLQQDITFKMTKYADGNLSNHAITIDVFTQDKDSDSKTASVTWNLSTNFDGQGNDVIAPTIDLLVSDYVATEDVTFSLDKLVDVKSLSFGNSEELDMVITVRTEPGDGISLEGMSSKQVIENGKAVTVWYKVVSGLTKDDIDAELAKALQEIQVNTGANQNSNTNNLGKSPELDISISLKNYGTGASGSSAGNSSIEILPETDEAQLSISVGQTTEDSLDLIPIEIMVSNSADKTGDWTIVGGKMYFTVDPAVSGTLQYTNGLPVSIASEADLIELGITVEPGQLVYVIDHVQPDTTVQLQYQLDDKPHGLKGDFELKAWIQNQENSLKSSGTTQVLVSEGTANLVIKPVNNIPEIKIIASGNEQDGTGRLAKGSIELNFEILENMPNQTSEILYSAVLNNILPGFIVYYGDDEASAKMAMNAGDGVWSLPIFDNALPKYISIKAPAHWSGTLTDIQLSLLSGEETLKAINTKYNFDLVVTPIADGIKDFAPTYSFNEGTKESVVLNLNIGMRDPSAAENSDVNDEYNEVADLILSGFTDPNAHFQANHQAIDADRINVVINKDGTYTYTIKALTQTELDQLEIFHKNTKGQLTIKAQAYTYEVDQDGKQIGDVSETANASFKFKVSGLAETVAAMSLIDDSLEAQAYTVRPTEEILQGHEGQDYFVWDEIPTENTLNRIQGFNQAEQDQIDVSQLLDQLGWDENSPLSDFVSYSQNGEDAQLVIAKNSNQATTIIVENNNWSDLDALVKSGDLKTEI